MLLRIGDRKRLWEPVFPGRVASRFTQLLKLVVGFDAIGDRFQIQATGQGDDGVNDCPVLVFFCHLLTND